MRAIQKLLNRESQMNEQIKLLEAQITVLNNTVQKMDNVLGLVFQYILIQKQFLDQVQVKLPEAPKPVEAAKEETTELVKP